MMWTAILTSRPVRWLAGAIAAALAILAWGWSQRSAGARLARQAGREQSLRDYIATRKAIDHADSDFGNDIGVIRDKLRTRDADKR